MANSCQFVLLFVCLCATLLVGSSSAAKLTHARSKFDVNDDPAVNVYRENTRPIVGILAQEASGFVKRNYPDRDIMSYIAASYVKFVEGAGGRVVPIMIGRPREYYEKLLSNVNGVLLPGGATYFNQSHGYAEAGRYIFEIAAEINDCGVYFPVWGTCLGFELMTILSANGTDARSTCSSSGQALPLEFLYGFDKTRLFRNATATIINILQHYKVLPNFHMYCFTPETFQKLGLLEIWNVMSVNHDWDGVEFVSSIEHKKYPFYGVQFHPEKILYEFVPNRNITHTSQATMVAQYFADFFVNEARKNTHHFSNATEEMRSLIYNFKAEYTGAKGSAFVQQYFFEHRRSAADRSVVLNGHVTVMLTFLIGLLSIL